jgi:hypothetical protein
MRDQNPWVRSQVYKLIAVMLTYNAIQLPQKGKSKHVFIQDAVQYMNLGTLLNELVADETLENQCVSIHRDSSDAKGRCVEMLEGIGALYGASGM